MKEKLDNLNFKYKVTLFTFILFLLINALSPISGDDWKSYLVGKKGLLECFNNIDYKDGRIISGILVNFLAYNKIIFDFVFAMLISSFVKICNDLMGTVKTKYMYLYPLIGVLLVSTFMFSYNYTSVTSTVTYTFPVIVFFLYFYNLLKYEEIPKSVFIKLILMAIFICLSSIHIAITFLISNLIYFVINSKKQKNLKYFILLVIELLVVIYSLIKLNNTLIYTDYKVVLGNISYAIENVFSKNIIIIILGAIPINFYLREKLSSHNYGRVVITLFDLILVFSLGYNFFGYSPVNLNLVLSKYNGIFATENWYYIIYFISYIALFSVSMNYYIKNRRLKNILNSFSISSLILIVLLLISPTFDKGNIVFIVFSMIMITCILAKEMNTKVFVKIVKFVSFVLVCYYISMFGIVKYIDYTRTNYIKEQLDAKDTNIEVKANPIYLVWRYNPTEYFQIKDFKNFYEIDDNSSIEVKYFGIFERIEKKVKE